MTEAPDVRKLDLAAKASINVVDLNNKVVLMRKVVRRAKLYVIHGLTRKLKLLRKKKGSEEQKKKNESKASKLVEEIKVIQVLKPDYVSKYALGSTDKLQDLMCKPSTTIEMRALTRLAENKILQDVVKEFREKHNDWKELAAYLMTKHTSREFKKKKTKTKMSKVKVNVEATETLVKSYLSSKLGSGKDNERDNEDEAETRDTGDSKETESDMIDDDDNDDSGNNEDDDNDEDEEEDGGGGGGRDNEKHDLSTHHEKEKESEGSDHSDNDIENEDNIEDESSENNDEKEEESAEDDPDDDMSEGFQSEEGEEEDEEEEDDDDDDDDDETAFEERISSDIENKNRTLQKGSVKRLGKSVLKNKTIKDIFSNRKRVISGHNDPAVSIPKKPKKVEIEKESGEMIVKRLKLTGGENDGPEKIQVPQFLLGVGGGPVKARKKRKDPFFDSGVDDDDSYSENNAKEKKHSKDFDKATKFDYMSDKQLGLQALSTTFLGSLNSSKMMECNDPAFRTNAEWKSLREDKFSDSGHGDFRGGGRGHFGGRGRGDFRGRGRGDFRGRGRVDSRSSGRGDFRGRGRGDFRGQGRGDFRGSGRGDFRGSGRGDFRGRGRGDFRGRGRGDFRGSGRGDFRGSGRGDFRGSGRGDFRGRGRGDVRSRGRGDFSGHDRGADNFKGSGFSGSKSDRGPAHVERNTGKSKPSEKSGPLHPSWEASQKRKQQAAAIHTFTGKKTTFDD